VVILHQAEVSIQEEVLEAVDTFLLVEASTLEVAFIPEAISTQAGLYILVDLSTQEAVSTGAAVVVNKKLCNQLCRAYGTGFRGFGSVSGPSPEFLFRDISHKTTRRIAHQIMIRSGHLISRPNFSILLWRSSGVTGSLIKVFRSLQIVYSELSNETSYEISK
jgi:hypothetical protein